MSAAKTPYEQIKVFISSAMAPEKDIEWLRVREMICEALRNCPYINPYTIEDYASEIPSSQLYQYQIASADIVVLLVSGEVRPGVEQEFAVVERERKPLLLYFVKNSESALSVKQLRNRVKNSDICTYKDIDDLDGVEDLIVDHLIQNIISKYHYNTYLAQNNAADVPVDIYMSKEIEPDSIKSTTFEQFESCRGILSSFFGFKEFDFEKKKDEKSKLHDFGVSVLSWIVYGGQICSDDDILLLLDECKNAYVNTDWLSKRWDAILHMSQGLFNEAFQDVQIALDYSKKDNHIPQWITNDILIDCRNIENTVGHRNRTFTMQYQNILNDSDSLVYLPVSDRYKSDIYAKILDDEIARNTSAPGTIFFGSGLWTVLEAIENYVFCSLVYGSYTHIIKSRELLAKTLYKYGIIHKDDRLLLEALKICVLDGNIKLFHGVLSSHPNNFYIAMTSHADMLWDLTSQCITTDQFQIRIAVFDEVGLYFSDICFSAALDYMLTQAKEMYWGNSEDYLKAILHAHRRIPSQVIIAILIELMNGKKFHLGGTISLIIQHMDICQVGDVLLHQFRDSLELSLEHILNNNGDPQIIAALSKQRPDIFLPLKELSSAQLKDIQLLKFEANMDSVDAWKNLLREELAVARSQFEINKHPMQFSRFGEQPYHVIKSILQNHYSNDLRELFAELYYPLSRDIFASQAPLSIKEQCLMVLCEWAIALKRNKNPIDEDIISIVDRLDLSHETFPDEFEQSTSKTWLYRLLVTKTIIGRDTKKDILYHCFSSTNMSNNERSVLADCILTYLKYCHDLKKEIDEVFVALVISLCDDTHDQVRVRGCQCLVFLLNTTNTELIHQRINQLTSDSSPLVRFELLRQCKTEPLSKDSLAAEITTYLATDAHYAVRVTAENSCAK